MRNAVLLSSALLLVLMAACRSDSPPLEPTDTPTGEVREQEAYPEGRHEEMLLAGTPYETALFTIGSGQPGPRVLVLGGLHGNEPSGWLGASKLVERAAPERGALFIIPRVNEEAIRYGVRSTPELGDPNRLVPGDPDGLPMERMAYEIVKLVRERDIDVVIDLHESWAFHWEAPDDVDLGALGQTISPHRSEQSRRLARALVPRLNERLPEHEHFIYHEFPEDYEPELIVPPPPGVDEEDIPGKSALSLPAIVDGVSAILVEVGQMQSMDRRVAQQIAAVEALLSHLGMEPVAARR
jgi:hypothetical protein